MEASPFEGTEEEQTMNKRLDEEIDMYHRLYAEDEGSEKKEIIDESILPKDHLLRKEAEVKILKEKINSVNNRLKESDKVVVNKAKIDMMVEKFKNTTKLSKCSEELLKEKNRQFEEDKKRVEEAENIINNSERNRD